jgi:hypothetical protein
VDRIFDNAFAITKPGRRAAILASARSAGRQAGTRPRAAKRYDDIKAVFGA